MWRSLEASVARRTRPACAPFAVAWRAQGARRDDALRAHAAPPQPSRGLACRQAARGEVGPGVFGRFRRWLVGCPPYRQQGIRPHGPRDRALPPWPTAHCILRPPAPWAASQQLSPGPQLPATRPTVSRTRAWGANPTEAVRAVRSRIRRRPHSPRRPAGGRGWARGRPRHSSQRHHRLHLRRWPCAPDILLARDGHARRVCALLPPAASPPSSARAASARPPAAGPRASTARWSLCRAHAGCVAKGGCAGRPARSQRARSAGQAWGPESAPASRAWPWRLAEASNPPLWQGSSRPAVPRDCRATPAAHGPFWSIPVAARTKTAGGAPRGATREARPSSRTASAAHLARPHTGGTP